MAYQAPIIPTLDYTYMYEPLPPTGNYGNPIVNPGTAWDYFSREENNFTVFKEIILKSGMVNILNDIQADVTIFAPQDNTLLKKRSIGSIINMNRAEATNILSYSILPRKIHGKELASSKCMRLETRNRQEKVNSGVDENGDIWLDHRVKVIRPDIITNNSIIHITDILSIPNTLLLG